MVQLALLIGRNSLVELLVISAVQMSAYGTKRTSNGHLAMSAFGGKADIAFSECHVWF
jgi:hypothetical protein